MKKITLTIFIIVLSIVSSKAQTDTIPEKDIFDYTLEELMKLEVNITSVAKSSNILDAPGIVTVVNEDEIRNSGARDLIDILRLVPGFSFASDVEGQLGIVNRGNWAHEGKILLMIDGQMLNELSYSTAVVGNHIPVENIHSIEIIRGPGSAIYGGNAEMSVINIITKSGSQINGISGGISHSTTANEALFRESAYLSIGKKIKDFEFSIFGKTQQGFRSDRDYTDLDGDSYNMLENTRNPTTFNMNIKYKGLEIRGIYDDYQTRTRDFDGSNLLNAYKMDFKSYLGEINYKIKINDKLSIIPKLNYKQDQPWYSPEEALEGELEEYYPFDRTVSRYSGSLVLYYVFDKNIDFAFGYNYNYDIAEDNTEDADNVFWNGNKEISYQTHAGYFQSNLNNRFFNTTIGMRYEKHNQYGGAFVPRIAIVKKVNKLNFKVLYNRAFRTPGIENIDLNFYLYPEVTKPVIVPEITNFYNAEIGYQLNSNIYVSTNIFRIDLEKTIVYSITEDGNEGYDNVGSTGSQGFEFQLKSKFKSFSFNANYSYYTTKGINQIEDYAVTGNEHLFLAAPQHKATLLSTVKLTKKIKVTFSSIFYSKRYAYNTYNETDDDIILSEEKPLVFANIFFSYDNLFIKGLNLGAGVYNIFDAQYSFSQAYNGWHSSIPGKSTEYIVRLNYNLKK